MHFFRIKIKRHRTQRRPSATGDDQEDESAISARIRKLSPRRVRDSIMQLLPFHSKVSNA
jgi:hypothetical protein